MTQLVHTALEGYVLTMHQRLSRRIITPMQMRKPRHTSTPQSHAEVNKKHNVINKPECFSIVVCAKNNESTVAKSLLASLNSAEYAKAKIGSTSYEIIVVYGPSKDNTLEQIKEVVQIISKDNIPVKVLFDRGIGLGFARQLGLTNAKCPIVIYADADKVLTKKWIYNTIMHLVQDPMLAGITDMPFILGKSLLAKIRNGYIIAYYVTYNVMKKLFNVRSLAIARSGNSAWKRDLALTVGGFPIWSKRAAEDYYLSKLLLEKGYRLDMIDSISLQLEEHDVKSLINIFRSQGLEAALRRIGAIKRSWHRATLTQRLLTPLMALLYPFITVQILRKAFALKVRHLVGIVGILLWPVFLSAYKLILYITYLIHK